MNCIYRTTVYPSDTSCLEIVNLTKVYKTNSGKHTAVNNISLKVPLGQVSQLFFIINGT